MPRSSMTPPTATPSSDSDPSGTPSRSVLGEAAWSPALTLRTTCSPLLTRPSAGRLWTDCCSGPRSADRWTRRPSGITSPPTRWSGSSRAGFPPDASGYSPDRADAANPDSRSSSPRQWRRDRPTFSGGLLPPMASAGERCRAALRPFLRELGGRPPRGGKKAPSALDSSQRML